MTDTSRTQKPERSPEYMHNTAMHISSLFYQQQLKETPAALNYAKERGLSESVMRKFNIGFAPDEWRKLSSHFTTRSMAEAAHAAGLLQKGKKGSNYDFFRGRLIFPVHGTDGKVAGFGGRAMPGMSSTQPREEGGDKPPKYLNSPESDFYHKGSMLYGLYQSAPAIKATGTAVVVEGYVDVVRLHQEGIETAVAPLGTAFTPDQMELLRQSGAKRIAFCFDGDEAGQRAADSAALIGLSKSDPWTQIRFVELGNMDPDDFIKAHGGAAFQQRVDNAIGAAEFLDRRLWAEVMGERENPSLEDKAFYLSKMEPYVAAAQGFQRNEMLEVIAERIDWGIEDMGSFFADKGTNMAHVAPTYIPEENVMAARLLAHNQVPPYVVAQIEAALPQVSQELAAGTDIAVLAGALGPIPEDEIDFALHTINEQAGEAALAAAIKEYSAAQYDPVAKQKVIDQLMLG